MSRNGAGGRMGKRLEAAEAQVIGATLTVHRKTSEGDR